MVFKYLFLYLSMLIPRNKRLYVFGSWLGDKFADNSAALFLEAQGLEDIRSIFISKKHEVVAEVRALGYEAYHSSSFKGIWYQLRAGYAIETNGISDFNNIFLGGACLINLWHGVPLKKICYDDNISNDWDSRAEKLKYAIKRLPFGKEYVVATSKTFDKIYQSAFRVNSNHVICLGQPRNDLFYETFSDNEKGSIGLENVLREKAGLACDIVCQAHSEKKKVILYAPTHRREGKDKLDMNRLLNLDLMNEICRQSGSVLLIKKHYYHREEYMDLDSYENIYDITGDQKSDTQLLLKYTDILVSDYSSIYIDYLLLDRPIIFYDFDRDIYLEKDRQMYFEYDSVTPGKKVKNSDELCEELLEVLSSEDDLYRAERARVRDLFYCKEGQQPCGIALLKMLKKL